jgi:hypothetical protein
VSELINDDAKGASNVERLRQLAHLRAFNMDIPFEATTEAKAADEIERLRALLGWVAADLEAVCLSGVPAERANARAEKLDEVKVVLGGR